MAAPLGACSQAVSQAVARHFTVLAWGRNVEGQTGIESAQLVLRPTPVIELHQARVASVVAGPLSSAAVTEAGEAFTWGDGKGGKLGHGSTHAVPAPHRVESLIGRASVRHLALGDKHSLFVDSQGGLWACGDNKEGQCGLGTPFEEVAISQWESYYDSFRALSYTLASEPRPTREQRARQAMHALMSAPGAPSAQHTHSGLSYGLGGQAHHGGSSRSSGWQALASAGSGSGGGGGASQRSGSGARMALHFSGLDFEAAFAGSGIHRGQQATPLRIGRDQHPLVAAAGGRAPALSGSGSKELRVVLPEGLEGQRVAGVAVSRHFSLALTEAGEVWSFGADYNGALGSDNSWSTSAQRVGGALASQLEDDGGARRVVSGGTFCAALTAAGRVVLWGRVPGSGSNGEPPAGLGAELEATARALGVSEHSMDSVSGARVAAGVVPGLPPITHIAAGQQHLLLSDGQRVWQIGRLSDAAGAGLHAAPWRRPALVLTLPAGDSVAQLTAGVQSGGVVTERGEAWVWGRLLDRHHAEGIARRNPDAPFGGIEAGPLLPEDVHWEWAGFGSRKPAKLDGLGGRVQALALGGWHALAVVQ
ncbi:hypothetical protein HYH03_011041 [Edaphochlamys debaryana]|uniref:Uncharacterized protein n=1 Tax=Edaphochlamys debaryana TaxID=47281 RepID=A0A835XSZ9_9CHLO|nr:hypothetical protein HYH03_011041 [Edaphochlamys debaryana]|eukprot:KAG2490652.1 hypothetical protein HYH03_011041 [Edaphochlamys debaryana]